MTKKGFIKVLNEAVAIVESWPEWKKCVLGSTRIDERAIRKSWRRAKGEDDVKVAGK